MSKQLALSIAVSVLMMTAFALLGTDVAGGLGSGGGLTIPMAAHAPSLPEISQLLPSLQ